MRLAKLVALSFLLVLNGSLPSSSSVASTTDGKALLLAADDSADKCAATCQEKRDSCFGQCKTSENPKICQGDCLGAYKSCRSACGK